MTAQFQIARLAFEALPAQARAALLAELVGRPEATPARLVRRTEAARMLACSPQHIDRLAREGLLARVKMPGRTRGAGFRLADVQGLIRGTR